MAILSAFELAARRGSGLVYALVVFVVAISATWLAAPVLDSIGNFNLIVFLSCWSQRACSPAYRSHSCFFWQPFCTSV